MQHARIATALLQRNTQLAVESLQLPISSRFAKRTITTETKHIDRLRLPHEGKILFF